ncbi:6PGD fold domain-containing protein [Corynebacterium flavescens]|uniref:6PGD fold domain-containing protein n=1 Tax=Corynebacterium flavescens TaxID=28028 RepID=UPI003FCF7CE5
MQAPRMRVAHLGDSSAGRELVEGMMGAGHDVVKLEDPGDLREFQALVVGVGDARLETTVEMLESFVFDGLIVIHTCLSRGVQVLDPLEAHGVVAVAAAPFAQKGWAISALDELGETIASLIVGEMGATTVDYRDTERPGLAARVYYARMLRRLARHADLFEDEPPQLLGNVDSEEIIAAFYAIEEPGLRRSYLESARRLGEVELREELELWALQEENK